MSITKHFPIERLLDFVEGKLSGKDAASIDKHLETCSKCQKEAGSLADITKAMLSDRAEDAPGDSIQWAKNLFKTRQPIAKPSLTQRIFAILKVDLAADKPAFAERSGAAGVRQMLYESDSNTIDLRVSKRGGYSELAGQILGDDFSGCEAFLKRQGKFFTSTINELNEFKFSGLESGSYEMNIKKDKVELILQNLEF